VFEYGTSTGYGKQASCGSLPGSGSSPVAVSAAVTGLEAGTTYHYRIVARNAGGTSDGSDETLNTSPAVVAPSVVTLTAGSVTVSGATLTATVNPNGGNVTECVFEYGTSTGYGKQASCGSLPGSGSSPVAVSAAVTGLEAGTTYHYRIVARNAGGTSDGSDETLKTSSAATPVEPGRYTGTSPQDSGWGLSLYVSPKGTSIQDVAFLTKLQCAPKAEFDDHFEVAEIPIEEDGSFERTTHAEGIIDAVHATFTYTLSGHFASGGATGLFREEVSYENGLHYECTTGAQSWTMTRESGQTEVTLPPPAGHYTGTSPQNSGWGMSLYVSPKGTSIQDVAFLTKLQCTPEAEPDDHFEVAEIPIKEDGSFERTTTAKGIIKGSYAEFTYTFSGHFHGASTASGQERVDGSFRETVVYENEEKHCETNGQSWTMSRESGQTEVTLPPPAGRYTGTSPQNSGWGTSFYVSPKGTSIQDVAFLTNLQCTPEAESGDHFEVAEIPINEDGSFERTTTAKGIIKGSYAEFTYTFSGHFHGASTSSGQERVDGSFRETVVYENEEKHCETNGQSWIMSRESGQTEVTLPPPAGRYTGTSPQNSGWTTSLYVSPKGTSIQDVAFLTNLQCTPEAESGDHFEVAEIPIKEDGSFERTTTAKGIIKGSYAEFTYTFSGHFHGASSTSGGQELVSGSFRETVVYEHEEKHCETNGQSWTMTRESGQTEVTLPPPAGEYKGTSPQNSGWALSFEVLSGGKSLTSFTTIGALECVPAKTIDRALPAVSAKVEPDGSFEGSSEETGEVFGVSARIVSRVSGHVHGPGSKGEERASGSYTEEIIREGSGAFTCSTNNQAWSTERA
jgi:hypothetical protein